MTNILVIEDDKQLAMVLADYLGMNNYQTKLCETGQQGLEQVQSNQFSCIILDLTLPDIDGLEVLEKIRLATDTPVLICSGKIDSEDRIKGLELGAKDYLPKPIAPKELVLRIKNILSVADHMTHTSALEPKQSGDRIQIQTLTINKTMKSVSSGETNLVLTAGEYRVLEVLSESPGKVFSRTEIIDRTCQFDGPESERAIDILISRIRKKIELDPKHPKLLETVTGFGYRLNP